MSRLLKDCLKECCEKDKDICDMIDGLGKVVEDIDCAKKTSKEVCKVKKEIKKEVKEEIKAETGEAIKEVRDELIDLYKKLDCSKWVIGEYKWMPVGSKMPEGWVKIELGEGLTLVQGSKDGTTNGKIQVHQHYHDPLWDNKGSWVVRNFSYQNAGGTSDRLTNTVSTLDDGGVAFQTADHGTNLDANQKANLAAGKFAELWQFQGVDEKKSELEKCLGKSIEKSIEECLDKLGKKC